MIRSAAAALAVALTAAPSGLAAEIAPAILSTGTSMQAPSAPAAPIRATRGIPFNPPLDQPLRYRSSQFPPGDATTAVGGFDFTVTFRRSAGVAHALMTVVYQDRPDMRPQPQLEMFKEPLTFRLSPVGRILGVEGEADWMNRAETRMRRRGLPDEMIRAVIGRLRELTPEKRLYQLVRNATLVTVFAGRELAVGESSRVPETFFGPAEYPGIERQFPEMEWEIALESTAGGQARVIRQRHLGRATVEAVARADGMNVPPGAPGAAPQHRRDEALVSLATGLLEHIESATTIDRPEGPAVNFRWKVERLRP